MAEWTRKAQDKDTYFKGLHAERFPDAIRSLLMEASLLYHVPIGYLMPDGKMLKEESIRFFSIDHNWTLAYMDGICSVGRNASIDYSHDTRLLVRQYQESLRQNAAVRRTLQGQEPKPAAPDQPKLAPADWEICSGFLLRSVLVEDFRGLEFKAYASQAGGTPLMPLRIETLGKGVLLGIFRGEVRRLDIAQPPEGLHFGFIKEAAGAGEFRYEKTMRNLSDGMLNRKTAGVKLRPTKDAPRVIDVEATAACILEAVRSPGGNGICGEMAETMTSAEFALEMIQNAHTGVFTME